LLLTAAVVTAAACGATTRSTSGVRQMSTAVLTGGTVSFRTLNDGKDDDSPLTVELLHPNGQLAAQLRVVDVEFNDHSQTTPMSLSTVGPFRVSDIDDGQLRLRMTAEGDDEWMFDATLTLNFSDNTQRSFSWLGLELDDDNGERTLKLESGAR
jgi:hypothetical protein